MRTGDRILVSVKTYPELSKTYGETVCTAGLREDGTWVRLYPVPFRRLEEREWYRLYDWITCPLTKHSGDERKALAKSGSFRFRMRSSETCSRSQCRTSPSRAA